MTRVATDDDDVRLWLTALLAGLMHLAGEIGEPQTNRMLVAMNKASADYRQSAGEAEYRSWFEA